MVAVDDVVANQEMPSGNRVYGQKLAPKGRFKFTSAESGEHAICLFTADAGWFGSTKLIPDGALSDLAQRVRDLSHKVGDIRRDQSYLRDHEREFRDKSESTNAHTVTWTIVQLVVLGITCATQLRSLRRFFETKKLV
ncbi:emp24p/erv25p- protein [Gamsiella multidivaricata]|nr:emp24p/erv25p- protein [Gamsiella multidivaricata]